ncbi:ankyrin repeat family protein [Rhynchospora pubera]|uniref:Ankyrin repeat family protein n=1 Tax=Rhynchospora pubera TaxID=906938 RepID=A0AAV8BST7_9POAL|nr:ankyrin repeat family protein [Rhynchospora pubera]
MEAPKYPEKEPKPVAVRRKDRPPPRAYNTERIGPKYLEKEPKPYAEHSSAHAVRLLVDESSASDESSYPIDQSGASHHSTSGYNPPMDWLLLKACSTGNLDQFEQLILHDPNIVLSVTPHRNNCLHIAAMLGRDKFAMEVWSRFPLLFSLTNKDGETPLMAALMAANQALASDMLNAASELLQHDIEAGQQFNNMLLQTDKRGDNALHHAIRNGFEDLALELLEKNQHLSVKPNKIAESPMCMAARKGYSKVVERLLEIPSAVDSGPRNYSALHTAVAAGHTDIIKKLLNGRPELAKSTADDGYTPLACAVSNNNLEIVKILLKHDPGLAYVKNRTGETPFHVAALNGFVPIAEEIISTCPDSAYITHEKYSTNALHIAINNEQPKFVDFILKTPQLHRLINRDDKDGDLPLHYAARKCNSEILRSLLSYKGQDYTANNANNNNAVDEVMAMKKLLKTLKWNESFTLVPSAWRNAAGDKAKKEIKKQAIQKVASLTARYTSNTSLVAALIATITFAAAFTLPGGFSNDPSDAGLPIFARKVAFQAFLISDTIAMCSSLAVAFLCILATWEDLDYLLNYRKTTRALMWCAYSATTVAFGTGLFTVMAPERLWLAIFILVLSCILPFISKIIGDWPKIMVRLRVGRQFRSDLVPNI